MAARADRQRRAGLLAFAQCVRRHGLTVPGLRGLLLAGSTLEAPAAIVDIGAWAGRAAAQAALELVSSGA